MTVTVSTMFIPVHDPDAALGLEVRNDVASDGFRWITVGAPLSLVTKGSLQAALFRSEDLDSTFEKVRDPSGNLVRIAQA